MPWETPGDAKGTPRGGLELRQLHFLKFDITLGPLWVPGGFSGHNQTLLPEMVLYITLIHLAKISKYVFFGRKVKKKVTLVPIFLHPQQCDPYILNLMHEF